MPEGKSYQVAHGFYAKVKKTDEYPKGGRVFFSRANESRVSELLSQEKIKAHVEAGNLVEAGTPAAAELRAGVGNVTSKTKES